jgi:hypothetical protein
MRPQGSILIDSDFLLGRRTCMKADIAVRDGIVVIALAETFQVRKKLKLGQMFQLELK